MTEDPFTSRADLGRSGRLQGGFASLVQDGYTTDDMPERDDLLRYAWSGLEGTVADMLLAEQRVRDVIEGHYGPEPQSNSESKL